MENRQLEYQISATLSETTTVHEMEVMCNKADNDHNEHPNQSTRKYIPNHVEISSIKVLKHNNTTPNNSNTDDKYSEPSESSHSYSNQKLSDTDTVSTQSSNYIKASSESNKWCKLFTNLYFWSRLFVLILSLILLCLSLSYFIGQLLQVKLDLITICPQPKTTQEIWQHSYESSLKYDTTHKLNEESQYGLTDEACWTTRKIEINTDQLWYTNKYIYQWKSMDYNLIFFGFIIIYCLIIIVYNVFTLISDIISITKNELHTTSELFEPANTNKYLIAKVVLNIKMKMETYLGTDTTGWMLMSFINESLEFVLQFQALLLYNGYHVFDPNNEYNVYLANKPQYIHLFAIIIAFNCFGSGCLWLSYTLFPRSCHGLIFKLSIYFVDQFSDLLYTLFPFIIIFTDSYNQNTKNVLVLLGQLNITSILPLLSAFVPLFLSCNKCLFTMRTAMQEMRNEYYIEWESKQNVSMNHSNSDDIRKRNSWIQSSRSSYCRKALILMISIVFISFGVIVLLFVQIHMDESIDYCSSVSESNFFTNNSVSNMSTLYDRYQILQQNPELFYWDKCLYSVYPFTNNNKYKCQCRVFVIDWTNLDSTADERKQYFNLTQPKILFGMLTHWIQLEKFRTVGAEGSYFMDFILESSLYKAVHMKAFEWSQLQISAVEEGISTWNELEYLQFEKTNKIRILPSDFNALQDLKYLSFEFSGLGEFDEQICDLKQLQVLKIQWDYIYSIPFCISNLTNLKQLLIDVNIQLQYVPLSVFNLPNLIDLSLFQSEISYDSLLEYNLPDNISFNSTNEVNIWFNNNFKWNNVDQTSYYLSNNPICDESMREFPSQLQLFLNQSDTCYYPCDADISDDLEWTSSLCTPIHYGDGRCDSECNLGRCYYDGGDCIQLCFANPELTNCSWDKYTNDECDAGCNNKYCTGTMWASNFQHFINTADGHHCELEDFAKQNVISQCAESHSIYIADSDNEIYSECQSEWITDGFCDDACRTDECEQDVLDCSLGCVDDNCYKIYQLWALMLANLFQRPSDHTFNYTVACDNWWGTLGNYFDIPEGLDCHTTSEQADYNHDGLLNFREFVVVGLKVTMGVADDWNEKATQVNCSACTGMEYYNA